MKAFLVKTIQRGENLFYKVQVEQQKAKNYPVNSMQWDHNQDVILQVVNQYCEDLNIQHYIKDRKLISGQLPDKNYCVTISA